MPGLGDDISEGGSAVSALTGATGAQGLGPGRPPRDVGSGLGQGQNHESPHGQGLGSGMGGRSKGQGKVSRDNSDVVSLPAILETPGGRATGGRYFDPSRAP